MNDKANQNEHVTNLFAVHGVNDIETLASVASKLGCSRVTMYRVLKQVGIPIYSIPNHPSIGVLQSASLWRLATTAAFKKYVKRLCLNVDVAPVTDTKSKDGGVSLKEAVQSRLLPLTMGQALQAASCGLIPHERYMLEPWFVQVLKGEMEFCLPCKKISGGR